jgi:precorrin-2 dehydrogenase/sirohydrochlorin ferrochelatase
MRYYPVFLDIQSRPCLVVGQGKLAEEKALALQRAGAQVRRRPIFDPAEACDVFLMVAVVDNDEEGRKIRKFADQNQILLNVVDQTENCHFIAPAILERGDLLIAVSTSGKSPALASRIRGQLEQQFGPEYADLLNALGEIRPLVKQRFRSFQERKDFYHRVLEMDLLEAVRDGGAEAARAQLRKAIGGN